MRSLLPVVLALLLVPTALAAPIELTVAPAEQTAPVNSHVRFWLTLRSTQANADDVLLTTTGEHLEWKFPTYIRKHLEPGEELVAPLDFYTSGPYTGSFPFTTEAQSANGFTAQAMFTITTTPSFGIMEFTAIPEGSQLLLALTAAVGEEKSVTFSFAVRTAAGATLLERSLTKTLSGVATLRETMDISGLGPGTYAVIATMDGATAEDRFTIAELATATVITERISSALFDQVTVSVTNTGNVPLRDYAVEGAAAPGDMLTGHAIATATCSASGGGQRCTTTIPEIAPGETKTLRYNVAHAIPFQAAAGVLVFAAAAGFGFLHTNRPRISKRAVRHRDRHSVILEVRNPLRHAENVIVHDLVSPLAHVVQEEFEAVKPVVNRTETGTELIWKLGTMKPRETRMLSYKVKPLVQDRVQLGRARLHYQDKRGRRRVHHSNETEIAG